MKIDFNCLELNIAQYRFLQYSLKLLNIFWYEAEPTYKRNQWANIVPINFFYLNNSLGWIYWRTKFQNSEIKKKNIFGTNWISELAYNSIWENGRKKQSLTLMQMWK